MAISDLHELLGKMRPRAAEGKYFFASVDEGGMMALAGHLEHIVDIFREDEGLSVVFSGDALEGMEEISNEEIIGPFAMITLEVESDLMAVGFLAEVTRALAQEGISANAFSAYRHDHILVPYEKKESAMDALAALSSRG